MTLNGVPTTVVGVLPRAFEFSPRGQAELWLPVHPSKGQIERKFYHWLDAIGRLKPGVTIAQASDDLNRVAKGFAARVSTPACGCRRCERGWSATRSRRC